VANGDAVITDHNLLHEQSRYPLPIAYIERLGIGTQAFQKCGQSLRQAQVCGLVSNLSTQHFEFGLQGLFASPQFRHPATQFVQGEQLLLIGGQ
jgi:hypothetical protein